MAGGVCLRAGAAMAVMLGVLAPVAAIAQPATIKVAYYNIKSGKGQIGLTGPATFADTGNCTDPSQPMNAWGTGLVQQHLVESLGNDPSVIALGLGEAWASICGSPENVRRALGWAARSSERNGVAMVARHGFAGPEEWIQLDTTLNSNPADTKWILRRDVCLDAACSQSMPVFVTHWYGTGTHASTTYARQAQQTLDFVTRAGQTPHVMIGDFNVFEGTSTVCSQSPNNTALVPLRAAGYIDAWPLLHGSAEGFTGMVNRKGCGNPVGYTWKRIDYAWSPSFLQPLSMNRFGMVPPGIEAPSDHYGIVAEYPWPGGQAPTDTTAPIVNILSPVSGTMVTAGTAVEIRVDATDDLGVSRVEILQNGLVIHTLTSAPYQVTSGIVASAPGTQTLAARAFDAAGNMAVSAAVSLTVEAPYAPPGQQPPPGPAPVVPPAAAPGEIVLFAHDATAVAGNWQMVGDSTAAGGVRIWNPDAGLAKLNTALAQPADYFELTFEAEAGVAYRVWFRGRAEKNHWANDSVFFQFSGSVSASGAPVYRIGTTSATWLGVERCSGCPLRNWGWNDNGYGGPGPLVYFATSGPQTLRVQRREDGISIDQVVLSPAQYLVQAPGADADDTTILVAAAPVPPPATEILITASALKTIAGGWRLLTDASAAGGLAFGHPDAGAPKLPSALAVPTHYVELTFPAEAGLPYRLWIRGRADKDHWANDSVFVQFDGSVTATGQPAARIGTTGSYSINLEEDAHWGVAGWGWQDNGYGAGVLGPLIAFENTGIQTIRIQTREDGLRIDQIVLSSARYLTTAPGALKHDTTILTAPPAGAATPPPAQEPPPPVEEPPPPVQEPPPPVQEPAPLPVPVATDILLMPGAGASAAGRWIVRADATAAGGFALHHPDAGAPKLAAPLAQPTDFFEMTFEAVAGAPYRLWLRGRADGNSWANDSVFVQFSGAVDAAGRPAFRIGTTEATEINLEECSGCGLSGWMWQDNGWGRGVLGPVIYFAATGSQTIRVQTREDGLRIDQLLLSPETYLHSSPAGILAAGSATPQASFTARHLRVLQWNLHHGVGTDGKYDLGRIASWIVSMAPDVVLLNEVEKFTGWGNEDQPERYRALLEAQTGVTWYAHFAQRYGNWTGNAQGNLILSRYPFESTARRALSFERSIAAAVITVHGRPVTLMATHLDHQSEARRLTQVDEILGWASERPENRIIGGDFNAWPLDAPISRMSAAYADTWAVAAADGTAEAFPGNSPFGATLKGRIDYIFHSQGASDLRVVSSRVYDTRDPSGVMPSDHRPLLTVFEVR